MSSQDFIHAFEVADGILDEYEDINQFRYEKAGDFRYYAKFIRRRRNIILDVFGATDKNLSKAILKAAEKVKEGMEINNGRQ